MFDLERWQEIFDTIRKNKLRTFLTGLSVASGIFILVILLGFGQGMQNGIAKEFEQDAATSVWVWPGVTTKEYKGMNPGRRIQLRNENYDFAAVLLADKIEHKSPRLFVRNSFVNYGKESLAYNVQGVSAQFQFIENEFMSQGRFLNQQDVDLKSKVAIISNKIKREVFKDVESPIGEILDISGISFKIVGVYGDIGGEREEDRIYIPISTAQQVFNGADYINNLAYTLPPAKDFETAVVQSIQFKNAIKSYLQQAHTVAPDDTSAIQVYNPMEEAKRFYSLMGGIKFFFWFVDGTVREISIFTTKVSTFGNQIAVIPNGQLSNNTIINYNALDTRRDKIDVGIGYGSNIKQAKEILLAIVNERDTILKAPAPEVYVGELADSSVNLTLRFWANNPDFWAAHFYVLEEIKYRFDAAGIEIPFPQRVVTQLKS